MTNKVVSKTLNIFTRKGKYLEQNLNWILSKKLVFIIEILTFFKKRYCLNGAHWREQFYEKLKKWLVKLICVRAHCLYIFCIRVYYLYIFCIRVYCLYIFCIRVYCLYIFYSCILLVYILCPCILLVYILYSCILLIYIMYSCILLVYILY